MFNARQHGELFCQYTGMNLRNREILRNEFSINPNARCTKNIF